MAEIVERVDGPRCGLVDQHEAAAAADSGHVRLDHAQRGADGDRRVDGRAALEKRAAAGGRGETMSGGDDAIAANRRRAIRAGVRSVANADRGTSRLDHA